MQGDVTSYDFWYAGISSEILKPAATATSWTWDALLAAEWNESRGLLRSFLEGSYL